MNEKTAGYTLIETLVALTLVLLLLFFVNDILPIIALGSEQRLLLTGINGARNQMEETLTFKKNTEISKELGSHLNLIQTIEKQNNFLLITITIRVKNTNRILYRLQAYDSI